MKAKIPGVRCTVRQIILGLAVPLIAFVALGGSPDQVMWVSTTDTSWAVDYTTADQIALFGLREPGWTYFSGDGLRSGNVVGLWLALGLLLAFNVAFWGHIRSAYMGTAQFPTRA